MPTCIDPKKYTIETHNPPYLQLYPGNVDADGNVPDLPQHVAVRIAASQEANTPTFKFRSRKNGEWESLIPEADIKEEERWMWDKVEVIGIWVLSELEGKVMSEKIQLPAWLQVLRCFLNCLDDLCAK